MAQFDCFKCGGSGEVAFRHIANGVCFQCGGTGKLSARKSAPHTYRDQPGAPVVLEAERSTDKQWAYLARIMGDSDREICSVLRQAGAKIANQMYVSRKVMSAAIDLAHKRGARA